MGLPLAFVALPLYVVLPNYYARGFGVPLATLGVVLLCTRLLDALVDPVLGRWSDRLFARSTRVVLLWAAGAALALALGFALLFFPPMSAIPVLVAWACACLMLTYIAYSALSITHQSWGAMLGGDEAQRSRIVAWRGVKGWDWWVWWWPRWPRWRWACRQPPPSFLLRCLPVGWHGARRMRPSHRV
jgi:Na+/melibiose symporter-like transporter